MNDSLSSKLINAISYVKSHTLDKGFLKKILLTVITIHSPVIFNHQFLLQMLMSNGQGQKFLMTGQVHSKTESFFLPAIKNIRNGDIVRVMRSQKLSKTCAKNSNMNAAVLNLT